MFYKYNVEESKTKETFFWLLWGTFFYYYRIIQSSIYYQKIILEYFIMNKFIEIKLEIYYKLIYFSKFVGALYLKEIKKKFLDFN